MAAFDELKERFLRQVPMATLVGESVELTTRSGQPTGLCPFHEEKSPSFYVFDDHYHCFGCRAHGDVIAFVQNVHSLSFREALQWLSRKTGVELPETSHQRTPWREKARGQEVRTLAQTFFREQLATEPAAGAREYLAGRRLDAETIERWQLGYAPGRRFALSQFLRRKGCGRQEIVDQSLSYPENNRGDFFRDRVMIPIRNVHGEVIAFGGRALGDQNPKYKNSRYDKSRFLFGMYEARRAIKEKARAFVVEGYLDAIRMHSAGFPETVACQGTALTREHLNQLGAVTGLVILLFDGDRAGEQASLKVAEQLVAWSELVIRVACLPSGEDPDSFLAKEGPEALDRVVAGSQELLDFAITRQLVEAGEGAGLSRLQKQIVPWLRAVSDPLRRSLLVGRAASLAGVAPPVLEALLVAPKEGAPKGPEAPAREAAPLSKLSPWDLELLATIYCGKGDDPEVWRAAALFIEGENPLPPPWQDLALRTAQALAGGAEPGEIRREWHQVSAPELARVQALEPALGDLSAGDRLEKLRLHWRQKVLQSSIDALKAQLIRTSSHPNVKDQCHSIMTAIAQLSREIEAIGRTLRGEDPAPSSP